MKNYYLIALLGLLFAGCSIDNDEIENYSDQLKVADVSVDCTIDAGTDKTVTITNEYVRKNLYGVNLLNNYFLGMLDEGVSKNGTFNPSIYSLVKSYKTNNFQTFTTTYTVSNGDCNDSVELNLTVVLTIIEEPICTAGEDHEVTLYNDYVRENLYGVELLRNYYLSLLDEGVSTEGTFNPTIYSLARSYNSDNFQSFKTSYTVTEGDCSDSTNLTLTVIPPVVEEPVCSAGEDKSMTLTNAYVRKNLYGVSLLRNYYLSLLDDGVSKSGTFSPSIYSMVKAYRSDNYQSFKTVYTITDGDCTDSVNLTLEVTP